ncbi:Mob1/phocein [Leucosporidium creatinivorum]|uniref:Mob1/phocein n=1 Tax=Leucosporidium creatinivorum TaxID=106004 RepID=A0A1Y2ESJ6_9BASI|nr:Mob1/phocein [Leucosporidium creatinivorum]
MTARLLRGSPYIPPLDPLSPVPQYSDYSASSFQPSCFLNALVQRDPADVERIAAVPVDEQEGEGREMVEVDVWVLEQLRRLALDQSIWVAKLAEECTPTTCPEMRANEWLYLCAAHQPPLSCCAIDYTVHTLDGSVSLLNSTKYFPSRLQVPSSSLRFLPAVARRLYRSFGHAFFHHRPLFDSLESQTSLYQRFLALNASYDLIDQELMVIPTVWEEEGGEEMEGEREGEGEGEGRGRGRAPRRRRRACRRGGRRGCWSILVFQCCGGKELGEREDEERPLR